MTASTISPLAAFFMGLALTLVPSFGPIVAAVLLLTRRMTLQRRDLLWAATAAVMGVAALVGDGPAGGLWGVASVAGPWIVFRTFYDLKHVHGLEHRRTQIGFGLLAGFALVVGSQLLTLLTTVNLDTSLTIAQAIVWDGSPALFGHSVLVLGGLIALLARDDWRVAWGAMALAAFGILVSGSREAAFGWVVLAVLQLVTRDADSRRLRPLEVVLLAAMIAISAGIAPLLGWGTVGFRVASDTGAGAGANLLTGTEVASGDWWDDRWVDVRAAEAELGGQLLTVYDVRKNGSEEWLRLQQLVRLEPGTTYTLSGWIADPPEAVPGFQGWGQLDGVDRAFVMTGRLRDGEWTANVTGPGELLDAREIARDGMWRRVAVTFRFDEDAQPVTWFVGFAPDARPQEGGSGRFAGLQLEAAAEAGPYHPAPASGGLPFRLARAPLWSVAGQAIVQRPLFGWGQDAFSEVYLEARPGQDRVHAVPGHPHNQLLHTLFERGLVGLVGLVLLLISLFGLVVRYRDVGFLSVVVVVLLANTFESTLLYGGVLYPLAAVAGWRSARRGVRRSEGAEAARQTTVRIVLAGVETFMILALLLVVQRIAAAGSTPFPISATLLYGLLLWPALAWREGLLPGYGLMPAQELKKQTTAALYAGAIFTATTLVLPDVFGMPAGVVAGFVAATFVVTPMTRALTKRLLQTLRLWGRPVVILGAGTTGERVVRSLLRTPLDGLHPLALFDDDPAQRGRQVQGLRVRGTLDDAFAFAQRHHVRHAIVAIPTLAPERLDRLVNGSGRVFRRVQFVPQLEGLPSDDVVASDLDGMLALEIRNGLFDPANRVFKRTVDLTLTVIGGIVVAPLLAALWVWVRSDSPGGAFHRSERVGQDGRVFACLKFRTMHVDAEARLARMLATDPAVRCEYDTWHKLTDDPRITRAGRFLRRTSLDELPQLWNVLRGQMSLVGPRPYLAREVPDIGPYAPIIFQAKPGVTGHWQVNGRSEVTFHERLVMEAHYVRNWSVWWDVILLVRTPAAVVQSRGKAK